MPAKGVRYGGGSRKGKPNKSTQGIKDIFQRLVDFEKLALKLQAQAVGGSVPAAKLCLQYGFGKPPQIITLEGQLDQRIIIQSMLPRPELSEVEVNGNGHLIP